MRSKHYLLHCTKWACKEYTIKIALSSPESSCFKLYFFHQLQWAIPDTWKVQIRCNSPTQTGEKEQIVHKHIIISQTTLYKSISEIYYEGKNNHQYFLLSRKLVHNLCVWCHMRNSQRKLHGKFVWICPNLQTCL